MKIIKRLIILIIAFIVLTVFPEMVLAGPAVQSQYYCLIDRDTGQIILSKNADVERQIASTTKMVTAILAVEYAAPEEIAEVSENADHTPEYTIGLKAGQQISMCELMKAALVRSSNDAAVVIAEHVAGDEALFAWLMSKKAFALGAMNTRFMNASGLPASGHYSTAYDLAHIGQVALSKPAIAALVASHQVTFKHPAYREPLTLRNTNSLLQTYPGSNGIKTGTADAAGKCLVASASRNGRNLIAVVLHSSNRNGDCTNLLNYGFNQCSLQKIIDKNTVFKSIKLEKGKKSYVDVGCSEDISILMGNDKLDIQKLVTIQYDLHAPITKGQKVGKIDLLIAGNYYRTVDLICLGSVEQESGLVKKSLQHLLQFKGKEPVVKN